MSRGGEGFYNPCAVCRSGIRRCACQGRVDRARAWRQQRQDAEAAAYMRHARPAQQATAHQIANAAADLAFGAAEIAHAMKPTRAKWWRR